MLSFRACFVIVVLAVCAYVYFNYTMAIAALAGKLGLAKMKIYEGSFDAIGKSFYDLR